MYPNALQENVCFFIVDHETGLLKFLEYVKKLLLINLIVTIQLK